MPHRRLATWMGSILGTLSALLVLSILGHASDWQQEGNVTEELHKTYPLANDGRIELDNMNGPVTIKAWDRNEVRVDAIKRAWSKRRLDEASIVIDSHPNLLSIRTEYPGENHTNWSSGHHDNPASVEYTLTIPRTARLDEIKLINGDLTIEGVSGDISASCINGHVQTGNVAGRAELSTINGHLSVQFNQLGASPVDLSSVNGAIDLTLPSDAKAEIEASTMSGSISDDFGLHVSQHSFIGHSLRGELGGGGTHLRLSNVNGRIEIRHANDHRALSPARNLDRDSDDRDDDSEI
jgi:hypothetical protein